MNDIDLQKFIGKEVCISLLTHEKITGILSNIATSRIVITTSTGRRYIDVKDKIYLLEYKDDSLGKWIKCEEDPYFKVRELILDNLIKEALDYAKKQNL